MISDTTKDFWKAYRVLPETFANALAFRGISGNQAAFCLSRSSHAKHLIYWYRVYTRVRFKGATYGYFWENSWAIH